MNLLIKLFINDSQNTKSPEVRTRYASVFGGVGIFLNVLLFVSKLAVGYLSNSISIIADAFNNLSDAGSSIITIIGFRIAGRAADSDHPYGHGRSEYISGLIVAMLILYMGVELIKTSAQKILSPEPVSFGAPVLICLVLSILVKLYMYCYNHSLAISLDAPAFNAVASDSISDVFTTTAVLISSVIGYFTGLRIDGITGLLVGIVILKGGIGSFMETTGRLLGEAPNSELSGEIKKITGEYSEILGIHDLMVHDYGPDRSIITFHAEVSSDGDMMELHDTIDNLERHINKDLHAQTVIHMDPILTNDEETNRLRELTLSISRDICQDSSVHDFRIVKGPTHTNLIFDVVIPFSSQVHPEDFLKRLKAAIKDKEPDCYLVVTIDRE